MRYAMILVVMLITMSVAGEYVVGYGVLAGSNCVRVGDRQL